MFVSPAMAGRGEHWPQISIKPKWISDLNERFAGTSGSFHDNSYRAFLVDYDPAGNYLNWGMWKEFKNDGEIVIADDGLPKALSEARPYWNPVTLAHYALTHHGKMLLGKPGDNRALFLKAADKLIALQLPNGGFPYPSLPYRQSKLPDGWISAMAQGNAMSVFYRAWLVTKDSRYLKSGSLALANLMTSARKGGAATTLADLNPSLSTYPFLAEYPSSPIDYTLNGYMFALLGLHDWSHISRKASAAFKQNKATLERLLPYHDVDGFSTYDLSHVIFKEPPAVSAPYLTVHVYLLHALHSITGSATLKRYERRWAAKIDQMNKPLRITVISSDLLSPQPEGTAITFRLQTEGGSGGQKLYQFAVKKGTRWTFPQPFSPADSFVWTPKEADSYYIGFYAKNADSKKEHDSFRYQAFSIRDEPTPPWSIWP